MNECESTLPHVVVPSEALLLIARKTRSVGDVMRRSLLCSSPVTAARRSRVADNGAHSTRTVHPSLPALSQAQFLLYGRFRERCPKCLISLVPLADLGGGGDGPGAAGRWMQPGFSALECDSLDRGRFASQPHLVCQGKSRALRTAICFSEEALKVENDCGGHKHYWARATY